MSADAKKETLEFQTEVSQLLDLMVHSLYSNKEIFMRELISNASDANDKLRFEALANDGLYEGNSALDIHVSFDADAKTVTIRDNGVGMNRDEIISNIGTIASSGTRKYLESLSKEQAEDSQLIGQFGVGFYSSFIVADKVVVSSRKAGDASDQGVRWESDGSGTFTLETIDKAERGTEVVLHLREGEEEFADNWRLRSIIKKYSDHIAFPILMPVEATAADDAEDADADGGDSAKDKDDVQAEETVNKASALWARAKSDISTEEYNTFYKDISHDFEDPMAHLHNHVEGTQSYISLLYVPKKARVDLYDRDKLEGIKLYVKRVFIMDDAEHLMPRYLRFVQGVIDTDDLPLNVSREILQQNKVIDSIRGASVKRILGHLEKMAKNKTEDYKEFWNAFGAVLKEGPGEDFANRERIGKLLRFDSTHDASGEQSVSLEDYISRMPESQEKIYYITADSLAAASNSPHLEVFRKNGVEVILMHDRVDEWLMGHFQDFDGKTFQSVAKGDIDLDGKSDDKTDDDKDDSKDEVSEDNQKLIERLKASLSEAVSDVKISKRLTDSPSCLVLNEYDMAMHMQRLLKEAGHDLPSSQPVLEINADHAMIKHLLSVDEDAAFGDWAQTLYDQAMLAEGGQLADPGGYVKRINGLLAAVYK